MDGVTVTNLRSVRPRLVPGDGLLHPVVLGAVVALLVNDHLLKAAWPGLVTGKLSDFAGLLFFPIFLQAAWEVCTLGRRGVADLRVGGACIVATAAVFAAIKMSPVAANAFSVVLGGLQWLVTSIPNAILGNPTGIPHRVSVVVDPTDLIALPALLVSYWLMKHRTANQRTEVP